MDINNLSFSGEFDLGYTRQSDGRCFEAFRRVNVSVWKQMQGKPLEGSDK